MKLNKYFVIDFDSTFTKVEAFDVLADISLSDHPEKESRKAQIVQITNQGMDGSLSLRESLERRLTLLSPNRKHLPFLITKLKGSVSESFKRNKEFFQQHADNIYIISNGFREFIEPIVTDFGVKPENILANAAIVNALRNYVNVPADLRAPAPLQAEPEFNAAAERLRAEVKLYKK
jgi:D-3-phosphoglycerate dehydrogenase